MNITIINGTQRVGNESQKISDSVAKVALAKNHDVARITLENFNTLFSGTYINLDNASEGQRADIQHMVDADILLFIVPTYHKGIPSPLKNFLDSIKHPDAYERKIIGVISSNDTREDLGARQAVQVINGILAHKKLHSFVVPLIPAIDFTSIDEERIGEFIEYCVGFRG